MLNIKIILCQINDGGGNMTYLNQSDNKSIWLEKMLDLGIMAASYKAFWLKGIVEEIIYNDRAEIPFEAVVNRMIVNAWFPIVKFRLSFGYSDKLGEIIDYLNSNYQYGSEIKKEYLFKELEFSHALSTDMQLRKLKANFFNLVPYRLISPFFKQELVGQADSVKNKMIETLSMTYEECLYKINGKARTITIHPLWMDYIRENQAVIQGWLQHKLVRYIELKNPNVPNIMFKLDAPMARKLSVVKSYWNRFCFVETVNDIYTGHLMAEDNYDKYGSLSVDHFIPWSFVLHDEVWNLAPTFKNINSSKSDGLPNLDRYLDDFCKLQYRSIQFMKESTSNQKLMENYFSISRGKMLEEQFVKGLQLDETAFSEALKDTIIPMYQIARNSGFEVWER